MISICSAQTTEVLNVLCYPFTDGKVEGQQDWFLVAVLYSPAAPLPSPARPALNHTVFVFCSCTIIKCISNCQCGLKSLWVQLNGIGATSGCEN